MVYRQTELRSFSMRAPYSTIDYLLIGLHVVSRKQSTTRLAAVGVFISVSVFAVLAACFWPTPVVRPARPPSRGTAGLSREAFRRPKHLKTFGIEDDTDVSNAFDEEKRNCSDVSEQITPDQCESLHARDAGIHIPRADLPLRRGTFLYLVQGEYTPSQFWVEVSERTDSTVLWLSWNISVPSDIRVETFAEYIFFPHSSFNVGRNHLLNKGLQLESKQGWSFEFYIFADEDQDDLSVAPAYNKMARRIEERAKHSLPYEERVNMRPRSVFLLHYFLLHYRPARAGVHLQYKWWPVPPYAGCVSTPSIDLALEVFHRTALLAMMPYNSKFDDINMYFSTPLMNMLARVLLGPYAVQFRQLVNYPFGKDQKHAQYPREYNYQHKVFCYFAKCLSSGAERAARLFPNERSQTMKVGITEKRVVDPPPCLRMLRTVDYSSIINPDVVGRNWFMADDADPD